MISIPSGAAWRPYLRTLAEAGLDVASVGAWIAADELPPPRRRLARGALAAVTVAVAVPGIRTALSSAAETAGPSTPGAGSGLPFVDAGITLPADESSEADGPTRRQVVLAGTVAAAVLTTAVAVSVGATMAGRRLEQRWLARLARHGHPYPHRALAVRMAALYAVMVVPARVFTVRAAAGKDDAVPE